MDFKNLTFLNVFIVILHSIISSLFISIACVRYINEKSVFSKDSINILKTGKIRHFFKSLYIISFIDLMYILFKLEYTKIGLISFIQFLLLIPLLLIAMYDDFKEKIIPNRVSVLILEIGLVSSLLYAYEEPALLANRIFGMIFSLIIFSLMIYFGNMIYKKKKMGYSDLKLMVPVGLCLGLATIVDSILLSFIISTLFSMVILIYRASKKIKDEYISFGPFLVISIIICIFIKDYTILNAFFAFCDMVSGQLLRLIY